MSGLHDRLLAAHAAGDRASLIALYAEAADGERSEDAEAFFLTQSYVLALEAGHPLARDLRARLRRMGRED